MTQTSITEYKFQIYLIINLNKLIHFFCFVSKNEQKLTWIWSHDKIVHFKVQMFEMKVNDVIIIWCLSDSWLNVIQILNVVDVIKLKWVKILIIMQKDEYENIQRKNCIYQKTWVDSEKNLNLSCKYELKELVYYLLNHHITAVEHQHDSQKKEQQVLKLMILINIKVFSTCQMLF